MRPSRGQPQTVSKRSVPNWKIVFIAVVVTMVALMGTTIADDVIPP